MELKFILLFFAMLVSPFDVIRCDIINVKNFREMLRYFVTRIFVPEKANIYLRSALMKNVFKFSLLRQYSFVFSSSLQLKISMKFEKKKKSNSYLIIGSQQILGLIRTCFFKIIILCRLLCRIKVQRNRKHSLKDWQHLLRIFSASIWSVFLFLRKSREYSREPNQKNLSLP